MIVYEVNLDVQIAIFAEYRACAPTRASADASAPAGGFYRRSR